MRFRAVICACLGALSLAACSSAPLGHDVVAQANPDGRIAFDVVKIDDAVLATVLAQQPPVFPERFKKSAPPPALKLGAGDLVSVVIFESAANGLFGESLTEISLPPGAVARRLLSPTTPPLGSGAAAFQDLDQTLGLSARLSGDFAAQRLAPSLSRAFLGGPGGPIAGGVAGPVPAEAAQLAPLVAGAALANQGLGTLGRQRGGSAGALLPGTQARGAAEAAAGRNLETLLEAAVETGRPGTRIPIQQVGSDGSISVPYAGRIAVAGHTPEEVQRIIEQRLAGKAVEPQALVLLRGNIANSVSVAGEMVGGGRVALSPGGDRLLQVIAAAGNERLQRAIALAAATDRREAKPVTESERQERVRAAADAERAPVHELYVRLSRGGVTATVPLAAIVADPDQDIFAEPGDVLTLVRRPQTFSVFGATGKNTAITFNSEKLSLTEALAKAGGLLDDRADPSSVFLFRYEPVNVVRALGQPIATDAPPGVSPVVYRLDLREAKSYLLAQRFPVRDKDTIFVADSESRPVYRFVEALSKVVGPVETIILTCANSRC